MNRIEVYHAGTDCIISPVCSAGRSSLDFGQGFYLTDIYDQAVMWATRKGRERGLPPMVNVYRLDRDAYLREGRALVFDSYSEEWLDFVVGCRTGSGAWREYDYVEGGVADDRVIDTVNLYIQKFLSKQQAIENLRFMRPNNQICLLNQALLDKHLTYIDTQQIPSDELL